MIPETKIKHPFDTEGTFRIDTPSFLKEVIENSGQRMYAMAWNIFRDRLSDIVERATELNDPILNALMLRMTLYEANPRSISDLIEQQERIYQND